MKRMLLSLFLALSFVCAAETVTDTGKWIDIGKNCSVKAVSFRGHDYLVSVCGESVSTMHLGSCWCMNADTSVRKDLGPRLFPLKDRLRKFEEQKGICPRCGGTFTFEQMEGDHILPYSRGGKTEYSNLQMLCIRCNRQKGNRIEDQAKPQK